MKRQFQSIYTQNQNADNFGRDPVQNFQQQTAHQRFLQNRQTKINYEQKVLSLETAIYSNNDFQVKHLLGDKVISENNHGSRFVRIALESGNLEIAKILTNDKNHTLAYQINSDKTISDALQWAATGGNIDAVKWLILERGFAYTVYSAGAKLADIAKHYGHSDLSSWITNDSTAINTINTMAWGNVLENDILRDIAWLNTERGLDIKNYQLQNVATLLQASCSKNMPRLLESLLNTYGCTVEENDNLLHLACRYKAYDVINKLTQYPQIISQINKLDNHGYTPLNYFALDQDEIFNSSGSLAAFEAILAAGADIDDRSVIALLNKNNLAPLQTLIHPNDKIIYQGKFCNINKFNVNKQFSNQGNADQAFYGKRLIDIVVDECRNADEIRQKAILIKLLRTCGSVEPERAIDFSLQKLIIIEGSPPDLVNGNIEKAKKILDHMYKKYSINNYMDEVVKNWLLSNTNHLNSIPSKWGEGVNNVTDVINKLAQMTHVQDRMSWDFKKVLWTLIYISRDNCDMMSKLLYTLSQLQMCPLSKLIHLLSVCQDEIFEAKIDYSTLTLDTNFTQFVDMVFKQLDLHYMPKAKFVAIANWVNDHLNKKECDDPSKWSQDSLKIYSIFHQEWMKVHKQFIIESYHFNDGLNLKVINSLIETICYGQDEPSDDFIKPWYNALREGSSQIIEQLFDKIAKGEESLEILDDMGRYDLCFGYLSHISFELIKKYYDQISDDEKSRAFLKKLNACELSSEAGKGLEYLLNQNTTEQEKAEESFDAEFFFLGEELSFWDFWP